MSPKKMYQRIFMAVALKGREMLWEVKPLAWGKASSQNWRSALKIRSKRWWYYWEHPSAGNASFSIWDSRRPQPRVSFTQPDLSHGRPAEWFPRLAPRLWDKMQETHFPFLYFCMIILGACNTYSVYNSPPTTALDHPLSSIQPQKKVYLMIYTRLLQSR